MRDVAVIGILTFVIAVFFVSIAVVFTPLFSELQNATAVQNNSIATASFNVGQEDIINKLDYVFLVLFIAFLILALVISYFISAYPIVIFFYYLALIIIGIAVSVLSYVWSTMQSTSALLVTIQTQFPITNHIMNNFVLYMIVLGFLSIIAMYAKPSQEGGL